MAEETKKKNPNVTDESDKDAAPTRERDVSDHPDRFGGPIHDETDDEGNSVHLDVEPDPTKG